LRVLAQNARPAELKASLLEEAEKHEQLAGEELEQLNTPAVCKAASLRTSQRTV
jgi:hypothetical protein